MGPVSRRRAKAWVHAILTVPTGDGFATPRQFESATSRGRYYASLGGRPSVHDPVEDGDDTVVAIGHKLVSELHGPTDLVQYAQLTENSALEFANVSDHYHPWLPQQGESPMVWNVLGAIAQATDDLEVWTGVTWPGSSSSTRRTYCRRSTDLESTIPATTAPETPTITPPASRSDHARVRRTPRV